jgi:uncharacterized membrane protein YhaH (DUF805 family)
MPDPGWYDDPQDPTQLRWWDGGTWTSRLQPRSAAMPPPGAPAYGIPLGGTAATPPPSNPQSNPLSNPWDATPPPPPMQPGGAPGAGWLATPTVAPGWPGSQWPAPPRTFTDTVRVCLRNFAVFRGRASRSEYWFWQLFIALVAFAVAFVVMFGAAILSDGSEDAYYAALGLIVLLLLPLIIPTIAVSVRRLHDVGLTGWLFLVNLVPWVGAVAAFVFSVLPGQPHANKYG